MKPFWQSIIGLEIHIELKTTSKMFCSCSADYLRVPTSKKVSSQDEGSYFAAKPNTHVCPICLGLPGALPVANRKAIQWVVSMGLALDCQIPLFSKFDRKNYFYPDLPKGYQISQYDLPLAVNGGLKLKNQGTKKPRDIQIRRVHLEEDTAKLIHLKEATLVDFNRSGVPLMEIVTEPDLRSPQETKAFLKKLQQIVRYLDISDCDMEKGSMRCEANVSVQQTTSNKQPRLPDYKVEIKNLNSFRFVEKALQYEIKRQTKFLEQGKKPVQETRGWDEKKQVTYSQREKEEAQDYRYFPEPDLPPIRWKKLEIERLKDSLPELPDEKIIRFRKEYGLNLDQARILTATREKAEYFEESVKVGKKHQVSAQKLANVIINKRVNTEKYLPAELIQILVKKQARPSIDLKELDRIISKVLNNNLEAVTDYQKGKENALEFLVGQVMKETKGNTDPNKTREMLKEKIKK